jgi:hypothetical protein
MGLPIIGRLLGHSLPQTTARYSHLHVDPLRRAADTIGETISAAMEGSSGEFCKMKVDLCRSIRLQNSATSFGRKSSQSHRRSLRVT